MTKVWKCVLEAKHLALHPVWITNYDATFQHSSVTAVSPDDICHFMAEPLSENWRLVLKPHTHQQFVTKMKNKRQVSGLVLLLWLSTCHFFPPCLCTIRQIQKTYIIHWFDGQSAHQMSSQIHHDYVSFQVKRCAVVSYFHPLISRLHHHHPNSGFLYYCQSVITATVMVQKSAS